MGLNKRYITSENIKTLYKKSGVDSVYNYIKGSDIIISDNSELAKNSILAVDRRDIEQLEKVLEQIELN